MLKIYKASAGSGKTYNLTLEFLRLLFHQKDNYKHTLAVTFTNKATEEMKTRIISDLYKMASGKESNYVALLADEFKLSQEEVRLKAKEILTQILHDYSSFNISTIDKFFQQTMRAFTREIGLQGGYNVELDQSRILSEAVDKMLLSLSKSENKELLNWLLEYSESMVEEGDSWDFTKKIKELSAEILKEEYIKKRAVSDESRLSKIHIKGYIEKIRTIKKDFEQYLKNAGEQGILLAGQCGIEEGDCPKYGVLDQFKSWQNGNAKIYTKADAAAQDAAKWTKAKPKAEIQSRVTAWQDAGAMNLLYRTIQFINEHEADYVTANVIQKNIFTQGILTDIADKIQEYKKENNIMLISDTTQLLNRIIDGSDTPFIYEKIGSYINHYMIDEFQDTSGMQWGNFSPLLHESLSGRFFNMIVGDVKQSIYRWRSSDWTLLDSQLYEEFDETQREDLVLETNYRSRPSIIEFNNAFFKQAAIRLQAYFDGDVEESAITEYIEDFDSKIVNAYQDIYQEVAAHKQKRKGRVHVEFLESDDDENWDDKALQKTISEIKDLQDRGYQLKDIAILVRTNREAVTIANALLNEKLNNKNSHYKFDIISNEALLIANSSAIKLMLSIMRYFCNPLEPLNRSLVASEYTIIHHNHSTAEALSKYFSQVQGKESLEEAIFSEELEALLKEIGRKPLYEMCEQIVANFLPKDNGHEKIFIQAFLDIILDFTHNQTADLAAFLEWWDEFGIKKTVSTPSSQNAIQIITVHKSKGLAFPVVIMPYCNWGLSPRHQILWCRPPKEPFNDIPVVPIPYKKDLLRTIFAEDYLRERMQTLIDNLNVAYVAFTRPEEEMILFAPKPKDSSIGKVPNEMSNLMSEVILDSSDSTDQLNRSYIGLSKFYDEATDTLTIGNEASVPPHSEEEEVLMSSPFVSYDPYANNRIKLRFYADEFFNEGDERRSGKIKHDILSRVFIPDDLNASVLHAVLSGTASKEEGELYKEELERIINNPRVKDWFSGEYEVLNEISLLIPGGEMLRPDRILRNGNTIIVIDYKFGKEQKKYIKQIKEYVKYITQMGYTDVKGYLWYVLSDKIEEVTL